MCLAQRRVARGVRDRDVPKPILNRPGVDPVIGELVATGCRKIRAFDLAAGTFIVVSLGSIVAFISLFSSARFTKRRLNRHGHSCPIAGRYSTGRQPINPVRALRMDSFAIGAGKEKG